MIKASGQLGCGLNDFENPTKDLLLFTCSKPNQEFDKFRWEVKPGEPLIKSITWYCSGDTLRAFTITTDDDITTAKMGNLANGSNKNNGTLDFT